MPDDDEILVRPIAPSEAALWLPRIGPETLAFLENTVPEPAREEISGSGVTILSKGIPPRQIAGQETGLVIGYVQSGKTMSFEAVAALARDNAFQIVIVVAGTSNPLFDQSTGRLRRDLRLDDPRRARRWIHFANPTDDDATVQPVRDVLDEWRDPRTPEEYKRTVLITVLKNHRRLQNVAALFSALNLRGVPVLIIDDEADQASLNTEVAQGQESTTYRRLMELRQTIPNHTYLQYTATPQAPLLISIIDSLSPNFIQLLNPGEEYVGGQDFFGDRNLPLVRVIPPGDVPTNANPLTDPPDSLLEALRIFMVGVTAENPATGAIAPCLCIRRTAQHSIKTSMGGCATSSMNGSASSICQIVSLIGRSSLRISAPHMRSSPKQLAPSYQRLKNSHRTFATLSSTREFSR
jgi:hypothetical protein